MVYDSKRIYRIHLFDVYELNLNKQIIPLKSKIGFIVSIRTRIRRYKSDSNCPLCTFNNSPQTRIDEGFWGASFC